MTDEVSNLLLSNAEEHSENLVIMSSYQKNFKEGDSYQFSNECSTECNSSAMDFGFNSSNSTLQSDNILCLKKCDLFFDHFKVLSKCSKKTTQELNKCSLKQLQVLVEDLTQAVEEVSSKLVQLLLENDALQQQSDARNIAIEQLLKMTVKMNESDLKPIQMSVILPDEDCDDMI